MDQISNLMMKNRLELDKVLKAISKRVYFQPPESHKMHYPCIRYSRSNIDPFYANGNVYKQSFKYEIVVIDEDPDSNLVSKVSQLPGCRHNRHYTSDNLNHDVFTLYY